MHKLLARLLATDIESISAFADALPIAFFIKDAQSRIVFMNKACEDQWGVTLNQIKDTDGSQFFPVEQMDQVLALDRVAFELGTASDFEEVYWSSVDQDHRIRHTYKRPAFDADGKPILLIGATIDITDRKRAEDRLAASEQRLRTIFETEPECVKVIDLDGKLVTMNPAGLAMLEADTIDELKSLSLIDFVCPEYRAAFEQLHKKVLSGEHDLLEFEVTGLRGTRRWLETHAAPMRNGDGEITELLGVTRDITERKRMEQQVHQLAFYDALTSLPNRRLLHDRLAQSIAGSKRSDCYGAVMFLDLDNFKPLNDTHGHAIGDLLLVEVARRITKCVRETDTVARFGGDEFVVILDTLKTNSAESRLQASKVAEKIRAALSEPYLLNPATETTGASTDTSAPARLTHHCGVSIGAALFYRDDLTADAILVQADKAMYKAKDAGRNVVRFYDSVG